MKKIKLIGFLAIIFLFSTSVVFAQTAVPVTTAQPVAISATNSLLAKDVVEDGDVEQTLEGVDIPEVKKIPSAWGLFWRGLKERASLAFTFDPVKKAEKRVKFAEERIKIADYINEHSDNEKLKERAVKMTERANVLMEKIEADKDKFLNNLDARKQRLLKNIARYKLNRTRVLDKLEAKAPAKVLKRLEKIRIKNKLRDRNFSSIVEKAKNMPAELKASLLQKAEIIKERHDVMEKLRKEYQTLKQKALAGDEQAQAELKTKIQEKLQAKEKINQKLKAGRLELFKKVKRGDKRALQELKKIKKRINFKALPQKAKGLSEQLRQRAKKTIQPQKIEKQIKSRIINEREKRFSPNKEMPRLKKVINKKEIEAIKNREERRIRNRILQERKK